MQPHTVAAGLVANEDRTPIDGCLGPSYGRHTVERGSVLAHYALLSRTIVAVAFLLTAGWKLKNVTEFDSALRETSPVLARRPSLARTTLATAELVIAAGLLTSGSVARASAFAAIALVALTTVTTLRRRSLAAGCGCWRAAAGNGDRRGSLALRNAILGGLSVAGATSVASVPLAHRSFLSVVAAAFALLVLEIPAFAAWTAQNEV